MAALRLLLLAPLAACAGVAWLLAALISVAWAVLARPLRTPGGTVAD